MAIAKKKTAAGNNSSSLSSLHPPYFQMISEAITAMKDRTGSSQPAIANFIEENYPKLLPPNFRKNLSTQLKRLVRSEKLVKVKNSYKISVAGKPKKLQNSVLKKTITTMSKKSSVKTTAKITGSKIKLAKKTMEKAKKTKRLSEVKTPEAMKKKNKKTKTTAEKGSAGTKNKALMPNKKKVAPGVAKTGLNPPPKRSKKN
ncbi:hypothetical protein OROGR_024871 [Orobanche gracilis]